MLRLGEAGHAQAVAGPHTDILKRPVFVPVGEVEKRRHARTGYVHARRRVVDSDQAVRIGIVQRLQQNPLEYAENRRIGSNAEGERDHRDGGEHR